MYAKQFPHLFEVVGVAEPRQYARQLFQNNYNLPNNRSVKQQPNLYFSFKFPKEVKVHRFPRFQVVWR